MHVILDLWGVLLDSERMNLEYNRRAARILALRFDGDKERWLRAYDGAWARYTRRIGSADWDRKSWLEVVDELDRSLIIETLEDMGVRWRPPDVLAYSRDLESQVASFVAFPFEETQAAVRDLRKAGHKVLVATQVGDWNAKAALSGSGLTLIVDGLYTGDKLNAHKSRRLFWRRLLDAASLSSEKCVTVDDQTDCLEAAAAEGIASVLMDRSGRPPPLKPPSYIKAQIASLIELLPLVEEKNCRRAANG